MFFDSDFFSIIGFNIYKWFFMFAPVERNGSRLYYEGTLYWHCNICDDALVYERSAYLGREKGTSTQIYAVKNDPDRNLLIYGNTSFPYIGLLYIKEGVEHPYQH